MEGSVLRVCSRLHCDARPSSEDKPPLVEASIVLSTKHTESSNSGAEHVLTKEKGPLNSEQEQDLVEDTKEEPFASSVKQRCGIPTLQQLRERLRVLPNLFVSAAAPNSTVIL